MFKDVHKEVLGERLVLRTPKANALHIVPLEDRVSVIAKSSYKRIHLAIVNLVHPQLVNMISICQLHDTFSYILLHYSDEIALTISSVVTIALA